MIFRTIAFAVLALFACLPATAKSLEDLRSDYDVLIKMRDLGISERHDLLDRLDNPDMILIGTADHITQISSDRLEQVVARSIVMVELLGLDEPLIAQLPWWQQTIAQAALQSGGANDLAISRIKQHSEDLRESERARLDEIDAALREIEEARQALWDMIIETAGIEAQPPAPAATPPSVSGAQGSRADIGPVAVPTPPSATSIGGWGTATPVDQANDHDPDHLALSDNGVCHDPQSPQTHGAWFASVYGGSGPHTVKEGRLICLGNQVIVMGNGALQRYECDRDEPYDCEPLGSVHGYTVDTNEHGHTVYKDTTEGGSIRFVPSE